MEHHLKWKEKKLGVERLIEKGHLAEQFSHCPALHYWSINDLGYLLSDDPNEYYHIHCLSKRYVDLEKQPQARLQLNQNIQSLHTFWNFVEADCSERRLFQVFLEQCMPVTHREALSEPATIFSAIPVPPKRLSLRFKNQRIHVNLD